MHGTIRIGDLVMMGADTPPDRYEQPTGFQLMLEPADAAEAERLFAALADRGAILMPLQETFWSARFGTLIDQFGIPWSVNCEAPQAA
jgi:PhnB protein